MLEVPLSGMNTDGRNVLFRGGPLMRTDWFPFTLGGAADSEVKANVSAAKWISFEASCQIGQESCKELARHGSGQRGARSELCVRPA